MAVSLKSLRGNIEIGITLRYVSHLISSRHSRIRTVVRIGKSYAAIIQRFGKLRIIR